MKSSHAILLIGIPFFALTASTAHGDEGPRTRGELRNVILRAQHLGAHGMGYGEKSLSELANRLKPADIPILIEMLDERRMRVGIAFALASQCEVSITPTREAAIRHKMDFLEAQDVMDLMANFAGCSAEARQHATEMRSELATLRDADEAKIAAEAKQRDENDARIQRNGLKLLDPAQAATLSRKEREEVYHRSVKALGLDENGPLTPQQKDMLDRMYRTMVLGESGPHSPQ
ncbi:MAG: hypothetical protein M3P45_03120 [Acidobacteriota bacterium]|nr:hypothetical protein [Acidobacteriota bacterium]